MEFIATAIENLKRSDEKEINNIISREQLISNLIEKKNNLQKIMSGEIDLNASLKDIPDETVPLPNNKQIKSRPALMVREDEEYEPNHILKHENTKKSMSTSCMSETKPSPPIQESPSMNVLLTSSPSNPDTSLTSELSSGGGTVTTTITITSTTEVDTTITKENLNYEEDFAPKPSHSENNSNDDKNEIFTDTTNKNAESQPIIIEEQDVYQIVESIRKNTNLSHELSQIALRVFISEMEALLPEINRYLDPIAVHLTANSLSAPDNLLGQTFDSQRLRNLFSELSDAKNDCQQRSWMLYEDEADITNYLTELIR